MEPEQREGSDDTLANGNTSPAKRGRGRPRGSVNKKIASVMEVTHNVRTSKRVDFFSPGTVIKPKVKKRGRPKKIRIPGRPRKIPLTPEEEEERILRLSKQRKRRLSKPLGRPRIHPLVDIPKEKRGRGRPRKYEHTTRDSSQIRTVNGNLEKTFTGISELSPRKRGRPSSSFKKKGRSPVGSSPTKRAIQGTPGKRGRPPAFGRKMTPKEEANGTPQKRGIPPGSGSELQITQVVEGSPRKRGRPPGSGNKIKRVQSQEENGATRKRGRPQGSGKGKTDVKETKDIDLSSNNAFCTTNMPRKRGRPSKASLAEAIPTDKATGGQSKVDDGPLPKQSRNLYASFSCEEAEMADADEQENADDVEESEQDESKKQLEGSVHDVLIGIESPIKKSSSSRVAGKSQKGK